MFAAVAEHLHAKGEFLRGGTIIMPEAFFQHGTTLIAASPSTKNAAQVNTPLALANFQLVRSRLASP